ncbi:alpha/beta hydrolase [Maridesulfovibrio sp.]|uniref:alpha/beta hydrolase n=1 Tax=Maridesulfovibrio sp. TaxID=2795000 RepID=UPI002A18BFA0|nr:alpha/beta hydrolase [Maridesulfovibrio sp.]
MKTKHISIANIPAIIWGGESENLLIAIHGNKASKADNSIIVLAEEATESGYQVLSFDLPQHGDRQEEARLCKVQNCVQDLGIIMDYSKSISDNISLFACSMGAYFSLLAYKDNAVEQTLFLSPVVDMESIITKLMTWFGVTEERLQQEQTISTPIGETLYWDYYCYVKENPISLWNSPTSVLYGSKDELCDYATISSFRDKFACSLKVMEGGEHFFHTEEQMAYYRNWLKDSLLKK